MDRLRILYVPNESGSSRQVGFRRTFANLTEAGLIEDVSIFSLQLRISNGGDPERHRQDLIARVRDFRPNIVLMQHLGATGLRLDHFLAMRQTCQFELIYHEADPYSRYLHPLTHEARAAGRAADVVFTVGSGVFADNFRRNGARDVRWAPHVFEPDRARYVGVSDESKRKFDIVVVANRNIPRFRGLPNWKDRIQFIAKLQERFGDRLALYGRGWSGPGAMGPVDSALQHDAIRSAWISANWDHFATEPCYFSDRLPISLAAGSIHATTHHAGYDELFPPSTNEFLIFGKSQEGLVDSIERVLTETTPAERVEAGRKAQSFSQSLYRQDDQIVKFLNYKNTRVDPIKASAAWDPDSLSLHST